MQKERHVCILVQHVENYMVLDKLCGITELKFPYVNNVYTHT